MLAYVFWHWPKPNIVLADYTRKLGEFHASLARHAPLGFSHSVVVELTKPPWLKAESVAFEDWYLVKDSSVLDQLNFAAVSGQNELPHNQVAFDAAGGTAGLYRLKQGDIRALQTANLATWFSKGPSASYNKLYEELNPLCSVSGIGLWCRQMTLGPTTEFCLRSDNEATLPSGVATDVYNAPIKTIWGA
jgi:hypothetical protein